MDEDLIEKYRYFLKDSIRKEIDFSQTGQNSGSDIPPIEKPYQVNAIRMDLVKPGMWKNIAGIDLITAIRNRQSRRTYTNEPLTLEEISFLLWAVLPYRMEWRYHLAAHKVIAIDIGHVCQNLYLACEAIGAGTCAIAAYDQEALDRLLRIDGKNEFSLYLSSVGKV